MPVQNPHSGRDRAVLFAATVLSLVAGWGVAQALSEPVVRPEGLKRVLRGMVLIKGGMFAGVAGLVFRRNGQMIGRVSKRGYTVATGVMGFAVGTLWSLSFIGPASGLFYLGLLLALWALSRDGELLWSSPVPAAAVAEASVPGPAASD